LEPDTCLPVDLSGEAFAKPEALRAVAGHLKTQDLVFDIL
jgi:hypothetical protein